MAHIRSRRRLPPAHSADPVAVALGYRMGTDEAPKVLASGRGPIAEQILKIAAAQGVAVREDADLAELLASIEIGADIPVEAFVAVAEILSFIYRANGTLPAADGSDPGPDGTPIRS